MWLTKAHTSQEAPTSTSGSSSLEKTRKKLKALDRRMLKNKNYFLKNEIISSAYNFNKIIIDAF